MLKRILNNKNLESILCMSIMIFFLINYNTLWNYGLSGYSIKKVLLAYPFVFLLAFSIKTIISLPLAKKVHQYSYLKKLDRLHITFPLTIILINSIISLAVSTYITHNYQTGNFFGSYLFYWIRSIAVGIPLFFFLVRPQVKLHLKNLRVMNL